MYKYNLSFKLNKFQSEASIKIVEAYKTNKNILLDAVCGAGKTEMLLEVIKIALNEDKIVGFACPRQQLLIELYERINDYFNHEHIGLVCSKVKKNMQSNFIFLTTHQLVKYKNYFDLLIIDEIDAFPFCDNYLLENAALTSAKQFIYLSATVPSKYLKQIENKKLVLVSNYFRHHLKKAVVPQIIIKKSFMKILYLLNFIKHNKQPLIVYVSSIKVGYKLESILKLVNIKTKFIYSKNTNSEIIKSLKNKELQLLISTTVLERGITLKKLNVIVYDCESAIFNRDTLIQICGRVGRDSIYHDGLVIFLTNQSTISQKKAIQRIEKYNEMCNM